MGSEDKDLNSEDSYMGTEAEFIPSSPLEAQPGSGPWGHPQIAWLH